MMELFETLTPDFVFRDEKGLLTQLVHFGFTQVNVLKSKKGTQRGDHYHKVSREAFYVANGSVELTIRRDGQEQTKLFIEGDFFLIPVNTYHLMDFPEDCTLVALYDIPIEHEDGTKDIFVEEE